MAQIQKQTVLEETNTLLLTYKYVGRSYYY